jgi:glutamate-1-semialdehyde 2,1-aminomutase
MATSDRVAIDRTRLAGILERERALFAERHPSSRERFAESSRCLIGGVPMQWMEMWVGGWPVFFERAKGNRIVDVDGNEIIDFCLGDTGAMAGHSPDATFAAVQRRMHELGGVTTMLPSDDAIWVGQDLSRRFGMAKWTFALTATDANRWALRTCRVLTGRPKTLVMSYNYHGSVDESMIVLDEQGRPASRPGNIGPQVDPTVTSRVVEFNDLEALERELAHGDVACVLAEPALTNIGIVLPDPGYWEAAQRLTRDAGALLIIDETHSVSAGPGGCTRAWGLEPDLVTLGKAIAGGVPIGAYGVSEAVADRIAREIDTGMVDTSGIGGTLAGNPLCLAAARGTLEHVLTDEAFARMIDLGGRFHRGVQEVIDRHRVPWVVEGLGARAELRFAAVPPRNGGESRAAHDAEVEEWLHLYLLNRGILITPFHNMSLMCPATTADDVDRHLALLDEGTAELVAA